MNETQRDILLSELRKRGATPLEAELAVKDAFRFEKDRIHPEDYGDGNAASKVASRASVGFEIEILDYTDIKRCALWHMFFAGDQFLGAVES